MATVDEHSRINKSIGNHSIERRSHAEIGLRRLARLETVFRGPYRSLSAIDQSLRRVPLLLSLKQFVTRNGTGGLSRLLQLCRRAFCSSGLSFRLCDLGFCLVGVCFR